MMGVDAMIYFKAKNSDVDLDWNLPNGFSVSAVDGETYLETCGATHQVSTYARYYGKGYERGPWGDICAVLMLLHASPDVEKVWYSGDCVDVAEEFTPEKVLELSEHYMKFGNRPYRSKFTAPPTV